jgi:dehydro coenzyme F420 reductase / coenzyme F420-0:L-glutamate ligase / coenzyme F420-1:gamma-L-glutamate ligase
LLANGALSVQALPGIGEVRPGDDIGELVLRHCDELRDGDIVVVTSKIVSKAEDRIVDADSREAAIERETAHIVARRGELKITRTHHGLVLAAAGVDRSNTEPGTCLLLPIDPDASARSIRERIRSVIGTAVGVVISDTAGRPWRSGQTDFAVGAAGVQPLLDLTGSTDPYGNTLSVTQPAVADEIASAVDLVLGKASGNPIAVVRGLSHLVTDDDGPGAAALVRDIADDLFPLGTYDVLRSRRTVREFSAEPVPLDLVRSSVADALTAPAPHHTTPWRFVLVNTSDGRAELLDVMADQWRTDLHSDGLSEDQVSRRVQRGDILRRAPLLVVPCLVTEGAYPYPDERRSIAEQSMFLVSMGAAVQSFLVALAIRGLGSAWVGSTLFCPDVVRRSLDLPSDWQPMGAVAVGYPSQEPTARVDRDVQAFTVTR